MEQKRCISSLTLAELTAELKALGQPGFRAKQIFHWVHQKLVTGEVFPILARRQFPSLGEVLSSLGARNLSYAEAYGNRHQTGD